MDAAITVLIWLVCLSFVLGLISSICIGIYMIKVRNKAESEYMRKYGTLHGRTLKGTSLGGQQRG